ncbi:fatty acyl-AMP ligase [Streptomyces sp. NBC_00841]|uniref:fatty acyl-AMP ligase n=1 Tax=unclassified Streptomyces TaxID=2593676 RepID=UPI00225854A0|nr:MULTISPECIES: fatty acyl-AMP ligase [unclassified Streptomyces]MCX4532028.1 fatty acyl-AMP ligase [Streptomyces sp. NBC_01669]WSA02450.1 fatty acyl-AMP ligase [Streptomyces sp. NBC_00841]
MRAGSPEFEGMVGRLRRHADELPDRDAVLFFRGAAQDHAPERLDYAGLDRAARSTAAWLQSRCRPGDRVLLLHPQGLDLVKSFVACLYAGLAPVVVPVPGGHAHQAERTARIAVDCAASVVLTDSVSLPDVQAWLDLPGTPALEYAVTDEGDLAPAGNWTDPGVGPDDVAFLQYTSGSTSDPRGVIVSHANIAHNIGELTDALGWDADMRFCGWVPMFHDMGLILTVLSPLYLGTTTVLMTATSFLKRPSMWLQLIDRYDVQISCAPNFAYDLCVRRLTDEQIAGLDLSRWVCAANGAEPVDAATMERFARRFAPAGFRYESFAPAYGLAETTLLVSGTPTGRAPVLRQVDPAALEKHRMVPVGEEEDSVTLAGSGQVAGMDVRIVDPGSLDELTDGYIGEVWVRGPSITQGYWQRPEATARLFRATTNDDEGGFLRTGDLGALLDGELFITGRIKEMLIIRGRNLYPHDIEREVGALDPAFEGRTGSAFSIPGPAGQGEEIVVVQEIRAGQTDPGRLSGLAAHVKDTMGRSLGVKAPHVVLVRPGQVRRTTSGKIQRSLMRELYLSDQLTPLYATERQA